MSQLSKEDLDDFKSWIEYTLEMLVDDDKAIEINVFDHSSEASGTKVCVMVTGKRDEIGKIIGKQGATIDAIRRVAYSIARRIGINYLELLVNSDSQRGVPVETVRSNGGG